MAPSPRFVCLVCGGFRRHWSFSLLNCDFRSSHDLVDLHRGQNLLQPAEDSVAVHMLAHAFFGRVRGDVHCELVASYILEYMKVHRVPLPRAFAVVLLRAATLQFATHDLR